MYKKKDLTTAKLRGLQKRKSSTIESKKVKIPLAGYLPLNRLIEINRDAIRAMNKAEKKESCKALLTEIIKWSSYSTEEAIGLLESIQYHFLQMSETEFEKIEQSTNNKRYGEA